MQAIAIRVVAKRALRTKVCTQCFQRPTASEELGADVPRACEPDCSIFRNVDELVRIAQEVHDPTISPYESAVHDRICERCGISTTGADFCADRTIRWCPLSRHLGEVMSTLEKLHPLTPAIPATPLPT